MKICIDAGHGGHDPGAQNTRVGVDEKAIVLMYATVLEGLFLAGGHSVVMTRDGDRFVELRDRAAIANRENIDAFIALHANACGDPAVRGIEFWTTPGQTKADACATGMFNSVRTEFPDRNYRVDMRDDDPDREADFYVLKHTNAPAVLIELEFISNDDAANWLNDPIVVQRYCRAVMDGIIEWNART